MGTQGESKTNWVKCEDEGNSAKVGIFDPVVYQLVRVQGDGRLVPATDDEVMEVEKLLEDDKIEPSLGDVKDQIPSVEAARYNEGCQSSKVMSSKKSESKGFIQSQNTDDSRKLNARLEYIEVMLDKVKQEERLLLLSESPKYMDVNGERNLHFSSRDSGDKFQSVKRSKEADLISLAPKVNQSAQKGCFETCVETAYSRLSGSETCTSSMPNFSILTGQVCLDELSIRELQEAFRATFGRRTSVKDKLWLKRRIAMTLANSYDVPSTNFTLKDKKIILQELKELSCTPERSKMDIVSLPTGIEQIIDQDISGKRIRETPSEYDMKDENIQIEQHSAKRSRKPTKRYIEELSDSETRECSAKDHLSVKSSGVGYSPLKSSRIGIVYDGESHGRSFLTRHESVGGFGIQVPYVSRIRRGRPRKNFIALVSFVSKGKIPSSMDNGDCQGKVDLEYRISDSAPDSAEDTENLCASKTGGARRKHHRAWSLCEVLKLVEGVSRFGAGRWSEIRRLAFASYSYRTSVDLKDKWRNLLRASLAQVHNEKGEKNLRKQATITIPMAILSRVRELAKLHDQTGLLEPKSSKLAIHGVGTVQEKGSGFL